MNSAMETNAHKNPANQKQEKMFYILRNKILKKRSATCCCFIPDDNRSRFQLWNKYAKSGFNWKIPINSFSILFPSFVYESTGNLKFKMCVLLEINYRFALFSHRKFQNEISAYERTRSYINNGATKHRLHVLIKKTLQILIWHAVGTT